jgi:hypothetical protein|tara:strand:- start:106 stop:813 length:708 start_codon:yes stop_codon:yes gene_type:complete
MTNSAPTTFDTPRIVTPADIIDDGKIDKTADFGINEHLDLIEKIEAEGAVATDLSDTQLDNLAAYFTSLSDGLVMVFWNMMGASSSEKNAIGLHARSADFFTSILVAGTPETPVRIPLQGCMTLAEHTEWVEQAKRDKEQKIIQDLNAWAFERKQKRAQAEQKKEQEKERKRIEENKPFHEEYLAQCERDREKAERAEPMDDLKGLVMLGLFPIFALFPIWFVPACIVAAAWLVA